MYTNNVEKQVIFNIDFARENLTGSQQPWAARGDTIPTKIGTGGDRDGERLPDQSRPRPSSGRHSHYFGRQQSNPEPVHTIRVAVSLLD